MPNDNENLLAKLEKLEADILEIDRAKRQQTAISLVGLVLIFLAIAIFAMNMYGLYENITSDESLAVLGQSVTTDMQDLIANDENLRKLKTEMMEKIVPAVTKQMSERVMKELPIFQQKGEQLLMNLKGHLEDSIKVKIAGELDTSLKEIEEEIVKKYPNISVEKLELVLKQTQSDFMENLTNMLEAKLSLIYEDLDAMERTLDKFTKIADEMNLSSREREKIENEVFESLLELGIYHLNPEKGKLPAELPAPNKQGGVK